MSEIELTVRDVKRRTEKYTDEFGQEYVFSDWVEVEFTDGRIIVFDPDDPRIKDLKPGDGMKLTTEGIKRVSE